MTETEHLEKMYRALVGGRLVEEAITVLAREGVGPGHHSALGQEALAVGIGFALRSDDAVQPSHRSRLQLALARGACNLREAVLAQARGGTKVFSSWRERPRTIGIVGLVGSQVPLAVGVAWADMLRRTDRVTVICFGEGSANQGAVHEAMNLAGVRRLPAVFVIENNGWAISTPSSASTAAADLASRGAGYGMPATVVAGHDAVEVRDAVDEAVAAARRGEGPSLIEARLTRWESHATGIVDLRDNDELDQARQVDGVALLRRAVLERGQASKEQLAEIETVCRAEVDDAVGESRRRTREPVVAPPGPLSDTDAWDLSYAGPRPVKRP